MAATVKRPILFLFKKQPAVAAAVKDSHAEIK